jgi:hypothetical protein
MIVLFNAVYIQAVGSGISIHGKAAFFASIGLGAASFLEISIDWHDLQQVNK